MTGRQDYIEPTEEDVAAIVAVLFRPEAEAIERDTAYAPSRWMQAARQEMTGRWPQWTHSFQMTDSRRTKQERPQSCTDL